MDLTKQRRCLNVLAGGLFAGAVGAVVWSLSGIETSQAPSNVASAGDIDTDPTGSGDDPQREAIRRLTLRRPLIDAPPSPRVPDPPAPRPAPPPPKSQLELTLVGTIIDPRQKSFAIVVDPSGKFDVKGVGEALELEPTGVRIQSIDSEQITLEYRGAESTVKLDRKNKAGKRAGGNKPGGLNLRGANGNRRNRP